MKTIKVQAFEEPISFFSEVADFPLPRLIYSIDNQYFVSQ